jgi:hypothetical protein
MFYYETDKASKRDNVTKVIKGRCLLHGFFYFEMKKLQCAYKAIKSAGINTNTKPYTSYVIFDNTLSLKLLFLVN